MIKILIGIGSVIGVILLIGLFLLFYITIARLLGIFALYIAKIWRENKTVDDIVKFLARPFIWIINKTAPFFDWMDKKEKELKK